MDAIKLAENAGIRFTNTGFAEVVTVDHIRRLVNAAIEQCAQVCEQKGAARGTGVANQCAAKVRALKDKG